MKKSTGLEDERKLQVFMAFRQRLLSHAQRILRDRAEAEDVVQDAFLRWQDQHTSELEAPEAWLTTVTARLAIDRIRKNERHAVKLDAAEDAALPDGSDSGKHADPALLAELADGFRLLFSLLTEDERKIVVLREGFEFDFDEIAALTGKSVQNCRQIASRAKQRLGRHNGEERLLAADGRELARRCVDAFRIGDSHALLRLLCVEPVCMPTMRQDIEMRAPHADPTASAFAARLVLHMLVRAARRAWTGMAFTSDTSGKRDVEAIPLAV